MRRVRHATLLWLTAAAVLTGFILLSVLLFPQLIVRDTSGMSRAEVLESENDVRGTLLAAIAGALFLVTAVLTWRQIQVARESQITVRYDAAVKQLASSSTTERIGGIYALQRVAEDSPRDEPTVVRLLSYFCCYQSKLESDSRSTWLSDRHPDIQIALKVLVRPEAMTPPLLDGAHLDGAQLRGAKLCGARLAWTTLCHARLDSADLGPGPDGRGASLWAADLRAADLTNARLDDADLGRVRYDEQTLWPTGFPKSPSWSADETDLISDKPRD